MIYPLNICISLLFLESYYDPPENIKLQAENISIAKLGTPLPYIEFSLESVQAKL
jgi:hypothetical protein